MWRLNLFDLRSALVILLVAAVSVMSFQLIIRSGVHDGTSDLLPETNREEATSGQLLQHDESQLTPAERLASMPLNPTYGWVNVYSLASTLDGSPVPVGAIIEALDPQGTIVGATIVRHPGRYGLMPLYMDLPTTEEDEGAVPGDIITFTIDGVPAEVVGPNEPLWVENGDLLELNLLATVAN